jgi:ATP-dependent protease Clp ATPase subunit
MMIELNIVMRYNKKYESVQEARKKYQDAMLLHCYNKRSEKLWTESIKEQEKLGTKSKRKVRKETQALFTKIKSTRSKDLPIEINIGQPEVVGPIGSRKTMLAELLDKSKTIWMLGDTTTMEAACIDIGLPIEGDINSI